MIYSQISGTGSYLPERILRNQDLPASLNTSDDWIQERVGIRERRIASNGENVISMAIEASKQAIAKAGLKPQDIDFIVVASCSQENLFPSIACLVQQALQIPVCPAFDVQAACTGFMYAVSVADQFIRTGAAKQALVIGAETMSRVVDWQDRSTCVLFGDGAGALILSASPKPGLLSTRLGADGHLQDIMSLPKAGYFKMDGRKVFRFAVTRLEESIKTHLETHQCSIADVDWFIPHQANLRIIETMAEKSGIPMDKVIVNLPSQGNTSAACIPLALDLAIRDGRIKAGHRIVLASIGGGATWGTALIHYGTV